MRKLVVWVQRETNRFHLLIQSGSWRRHCPFPVLAAVDTGYSNFKRQNEDAKPKVCFKGKSTLTFWQMHLPLSVCSGMNCIIRVKINVLPTPRSTFLKPISMFCSWCGSKEIPRIIPRVKNPKPKSSKQQNPSPEEQGHLCIFRECPLTAAFMLQPSGMSSRMARKSHPPDQALPCLARDTGSLHIQLCWGQRPTWGRKQTTELAHLGA